MVGFIACELNVARGRSIRCANAPWIVGTCFSRKGRPTKIRKSSEEKDAIENVCRLPLKEDGMILYDSIGICRPFAEFAHFVIAVKQWNIAWNRIFNMCWGWADSHRSQPTDQTLAGNRGAQWDGLPPTLHPNIPESVIFLFIFNRIWPWTYFKELISCFGPRKTVKAAMVCCVLPLPTTASQSTVFSVGAASQQSPWEHLEATSVDLRKKSIDRSYFQVSDLGAGAEARGHSKWFEKRGFLSKGLPKQSD